MFEKLRLSLPYKTYEAKIDFIPISALKGDNVVKNSSNMKWYKGLPLLKYLDDVEILKSEFDAFRYPVQYVNRPNLDFRGFCGTITSGDINESDKIMVYPSKKTSTVKEIIPPINPEKDVRDQGSNKLKKAFAPMAITLTLNDEIDISRGDLIVRKDEKQPKFNDSFEAMIVWMNEEPLKNREYIIKTYTKETNALVSKILFKKDVNTWEKLEAKTLELNDIARVKIDLTEKIAFDFYEENKGTGAFILIDKITNNTVAAGMIVGEATKTAKKRIYTESEIALNKFIREHFPEWECKSIDEIDDRQ
jgi:sulfate adenylyltransferase subunit 1